MTARVFCFASAKGGSGKTSLLATIATFLSKLGKKTLLIDADFATNGLTLLYLKEVRLQAELIHSTSRLPAGLSRSMLPGIYPDRVVLSDDLHFIPATFDLQAGLEHIDEEVKVRFGNLLQKLRVEYDFIFIDAQAGDDEMGRIAMSRRISDEVVIVSEYDPMSAAGVERLKALLREDLTYDRTWVLLNKILPEFAKSFSDFMEVAKYLSPIPWDAAVVRAYSRRQLALDTDSGNEHTLAVLQTLKGLFGDSIHDELSAWVQSRAAVIRQPLEEQYDDAEKEMYFLLSHKARMKRKSELLRYSLTALTGAALALIALLLSSDYFPHDNLNRRIATVVFAALSTFAVFIVAGARTNLFGKLFGAGRAENEVLEMRYMRQIDLLQERLRKLELLRSLDPESLIFNSEIRRGSDGGHSDKTSGTARIY